jgi:L-fuculose-phosphate aldolase
MAASGAVCGRIIKVCRRLDDLRFTPGSAGNVSARAGGGVIYITPTGSVLGEVRARELVRVTLDGATPPRGKPSSELNVHATFYRLRPDVGAVVHAHPPACVGFALARHAFDRPTNFEIYVTMGIPQSVPFAPPGAAGKALEKAALEGDCFFLGGHGVITVGPTVEKALHRMENLENFALATLVARALGGAVPFTRAELDAIHAYTDSIGLPRPRSAR